MGETSRSAFTRGREHKNDARLMNPGSHILKHYLRYHDGEDPDEMKMGMKIHTFRRTAFERQVAEAVTIQQVQNKHHLMNSKSEYRACKIPRISIKMGDSEMYEETERRRKEQQEDDELEQRIKVMKRMSQKRRMEEEPIQQRKRARLGHDWRTDPEEKLRTDEQIDPERNLEELLNLLEEENSESETEREEEVNTENKRTNHDNNPGPKNGPGMTKKQPTWRTWK